METLIVGNPLDKNTDIGAINSREQLNKIKDFLKIATYSNSVNIKKQLEETKCKLLNVKNKKTFYKDIDYLKWLEEKINDK